MDFFRRIFNNFRKSEPARATVRDEVPPPRTDNTPLVLGRSKRREKRARGTLELLDIKNCPECKITFDDGNYKPTLQRCGHSKCGPCCDKNAGECSQCEVKVGIKKLKIQSKGHPLSTAINHSDGSSTSTACVNGGGTTPNETSTSDVINTTETDEAIKINNQTPNSSDENSSVQPSSVSELGEAVIDQINPDKSTQTLECNIVLQDSSMPGNNCSSQSVNLADTAIKSSATLTKYSFSESFAALEFPEEGREIDFMSQMTAMTEVFGTQVESSLSRKRKRVVETQTNNLVKMPKYIPFSAMSGIPSSSTSIISQTQKTSVKLIGAQINSRKGDKILPDSSTAPSKPPRTSIRNTKRSSDLVDVDPNSTSGVANDPGTSSSSSSLSDSPKPVNNAKESFIDYSSHFAGDVFMEFMDSDNILSTSQETMDITDSATNADVNPASTSSTSATFQIEENDLTEKEKKSKAQKRRKIKGFVIPKHITVIKGRTSKTRYQCIRCKQSCGSKYYRKTYHLYCKLNPFKCDLCGDGRQFANNYTLKRHLKKQHMDAAGRTTRTRYQGIRRKKSCGSKYYTKHHHQDCITEKLTPFKCDLCGDGRQFANKYTLKSHLKKQHMDAMRVKTNQKKTHMDAGKNEH